mmetsp:Transcript_18007/g.32567  ORF Transcript_18007/g.32567 Transcript_18007/m.32567 type:complete len:413 (-) Transcript_18007:281-1519(-)
MNLHMEPKRKTVNFDSPQVNNQINRFLYTMHISQFNCYFHAIYIHTGKTNSEHPHRPIIDWDLILQLEPMTILGAMIGTTIYDFIPDVILVVLMILLLSITAYKTLSKANKMYEEETRELMNEYVQQQRVIMASENYNNDDNGESGIVEVVSTGYESMTHYERNMNNNNQNNDTEKDLLDFEEETQNSFDEQHRSQAIKDGIKLTTLFVVVTILELLRGAPPSSSSSEDNDNNGGGVLLSAFWITDMGVVLVITAFAVHTRWAILDRYQNGGGPTLSDIEWDERNTIVYPLYAVLAGLAAGMFGVGGGIIKGPLMITLGVHPAVASASSACMILYTSSISTLGYMTFGSLVYDYGAFCLVIGILATLLGQTLMKGLLRQYKRASLIAYSIGGVVMLSAIAMGIEATIELLDA